MPKKLCVSFKMKEELLNRMQTKLRMEETAEIAQGALPTFMIIGAMKSGTSSLHYWLDKHPEIFMSQPKEVNYFNDPNYGQHDLCWYRSHFRTDKKVIGESTTGYSKFPSGGPVNERLHSILPDLKLIYIVRDPLRRIYSHFVHVMMDNLREPDLQVLYSQLYPASHIINCSRYHMQLERYLKCYPLKQIKVICFEEMLKNKEKTLKDVYRFLKVDDLFQCALDDRRANDKITQYQLHLNGRRGFAADDDPEKHAAIKEILTKDFEEIQLLKKIPGKTLKLLQQDVHALRQLTGMTFSEWLL